LWDIETRTVQPEDDVDGDGFITLSVKWVEFIPPDITNPTPLPPPIPVYIITFEPYPVVSVPDLPSNAVNIPVQYIVSGSKVVQPVKPPVLDDGRGFAGWFTEDTYMHRWNFDIPAAANQTLYAKWEEFTRTVCFNSNGGKRPDGITDLEHEFTVSLDYGLIQDPGPIVKEGYFFNGWYVDPGFSGLPWNFSINKVTDSYVPQVNPLILHAKWERNVYFVNFVITPSTAAVPERQSIPHGDTIVQPVNPPQLGDGRAFAGWYTEAECFNQWYFDYPVTTTMILYARWVPQTRTVQFKVNGGNDLPRSSFTIPIASGVVMNPGSPSRPGYTFGGWFTDPVGTVIWNFSTDRITIPDEIIGMDAFYLYAKWTPNPYTVTFLSYETEDPESQTLTYGERIKRPDTPANPGRALDGWFTLDGRSTYNWGTRWNFDTMVEGNVTLHAKWDDINYTIRFHSGNPNGAPPNVVFIQAWPEEQHVVYGGTVTEPFMPPLPAPPQNVNETDWSFFRWDHALGYSGDPNVIDRTIANTNDLQPWNFDTVVTEVFTIEDNGEQVLNLYARWVPPVPEMVWVPKGNFIMGDSGVSGSPAAYHAYPTRRVTMDGFYISRYQVTQIQYQNLMSGKITNTRPSNASQDSDHRPVERVSWFDAIFYCNALTENRMIAENLDAVYNIENIIRAGDGGAQVPATTIAGSISSATVTTNTSPSGFYNGYRLPTEAEWEYAAKGGHGSPGNFIYAGSSDVNLVAWYNATVTTQIVKATQPVGTKAPNALGIYDMSGNVSEWCWDWFVSYKEIINLAGNALNPTGPLSGTERVRRGGAWNNAAGNVRSAMRNSEPPVNANWVVGFRVVRGPSTFW
jgi:uncharacterized repeat protein (TIGR02543 family)